MHSAVPRVSPCRQTLLANRQLMPACLLQIQLGERTCTSVRPAIASLYLGTTPIPGHDVV